MNEIINQMHDLSIFDLWQLYYLIGFEFVKRLWWLGIIVVGLIIMCFIIRK